MKTVLFLSFFALSSILNGISADNSEPPDGGCLVKEHIMDRRKVIRCVKLGIDGRSLEQVIGDGMIPYHTYDPLDHMVNDDSSNSSDSDTRRQMPSFDGYLKNVSISEIADLIQIIVLADSRNVTMGKNALSRFMNLTELKMWSPSVGEESERGLLNLAPGSLRQAPQLHKMEITRMVMSDESIREFRHMKDRLISIAITDVSPEDKVFASLAQFTALQYMGFFDCSTRPFPIKGMKRSAAVLDAFEIGNCYFPKLAKDTFTNASQLIQLFLKRANLSEIEPGALDNNPELWVVSLRDNDLPSLPEGIFSKLKKLSSVTLQGNPRLIGSIDKSNFTHVDEFEKFRFRLSYS